MNKHFKILKNVLLDPGAFFRKSFNEKLDLGVFSAINIGIFMIMTLLSDLMQRTESILKIAKIPVIIVPVLFLSAAIFNALCNNFKETSNFDVWLKIVFTMTSVLPIMGIIGFLELLDFYPVLILDVILGIFVVRIGFHASRRVIQIPERKLGTVYPAGILIILLIAGGAFYFFSNDGNKGDFDYAAIQKKILYMGYDKAEIEIVALKHTIKNLKLRKDDFNQRGISISDKLVKKLEEKKQELINFTTVFNNINWDK